MGPIVLKYKIKLDQYNNFLGLSIAIFILANVEMANMRSYAHRLLQYFVKSFADIYGRQLVSHNVHALLHMVDDCELFGSLDDYSCYPLENYLGQLKKQLRHSNKPLQQIINRSVE